MSVNGHENLRVPWVYIFFIKFICSPTLPHHLFILLKKKSSFLRRMTRIGKRRRVAYGPSAVCPLHFLRGQKDINDGNREWLYPITPLISIFCTRLLTPYKPLMPTSLPFLDDPWCNGMDDPTPYYGAAPEERHVGHREPSAVREKMAACN